MVPIVYPGLLFSQWYFGNWRKSSDGLEGGSSSIGILGSGYFFSFSTALAITTFRYLTYLIFSKKESTLGSMLSLWNHTFFIVILFFTPKISAVKNNYAWLRAKMRDFTMITLAPGRCPVLSNLRTNLQTTEKQLTNKNLFVNPQSFQ